MACNLHHIKFNVLPASAAEEIENIIKSPAWPSLEHAGESHGKWKVTFKVELTAGVERNTNYCGQKPKEEHNILAHSALQNNHGAAQDIHEQMCSKNRWPTAKSCFGCGHKTPSSARGLSRVYLSMEEVPSGLKHTWPSEGSSPVLCWAGPHHLHLLSRATSSITCWGAEMLMPVFAYMPLPPFSLNFQLNLGRKVTKYLVQLVYVGTLHCRQQCNRKMRGGYFCQGLGLFI